LGRKVYARRTKFKTVNRNPTLNLQQIRDTTNFFLCVCKLNHSIVCRNIQDSTDLYPVNAKIDKLIFIAQKTKIKKIKEKAIKKALDSTSILFYKDEKVKALISIGTVLDQIKKESLLKQALEITNRIKDEWRRTEALTSRS
jgi:hypothetical protein